VRGTTMSFWSKIKKAAKWVARKVKAVVRLVVRVVVTAVMAVINVFDLLFGFFNWPRKKLTLHVVVLPTLTPANRKIVESDVRLSIAEAERILKERFNVKLRPYAKDYVEFFEGEVPPKALEPSCCGADLLGQEFVSSGEFYAQHTAGWVGIPISLRFPITVFVVNDVQCKRGCSNGPLADYVVIGLDGLNVAGTPLPNSLMMHEMGHACSLWHSGTVSNIMYKDNERGDGSKWFQRNLLRSSRHVTYW
jgi:hypothetical protein